MRRRRAAAPGIPSLTGSQAGWCSLSPRSAISPAALGRAKACCSLLMLASPPVLPGQQDLHLSST